MHIYIFIYIIGEIVTDRKIKTANSRIFSIFEFNLSLAAMNTYILYESM